MKLRVLALLLSAAPALFAHSRGGVDLDVVVDGASRAEYFHHGTTYIEALRGREYALRLTNPTPYRVAVALSVDGLNTIDARHSDAWGAPKWVLEPYESTVIEGWQVSDESARRFYFTGERNSYGAALGETQNLGVIEAVFYRERTRRIEVWNDERSRAVPPPPHAPQPSAAAGAEAAPKLSDDYAATGMGDRTRHDVERVHIDLDPTPIASIRIRYEFRPQLVKLGVLPRHEEPLRRRERARGFDSYCPEPD